MDIIKGYPTTVKFVVPPVGLTCTVNIKKDGTDLVAPFNVISASGETEVDIPVPYVAVHQEQTLDLSITFTVDTLPYTNSEKIYVVTPYLELWELKKILETDDSDICWVVESAVRNIINAHCGQEFGVTEEPQIVQGEKESTLGVERPVIRLDRLVEDGEDRYNIATSLGAGYWLGKDDYKIIGEGWYIKRPDYRTNSPRGQAPSYSSDPIRVPGTWSGNQFLNDGQYKLYGRFGYEQVPSGVKEAAKLLVNDYACAEQSYRDRYLANIRAGDWRIEYNAGAWVATGNARADQLLEQYVVNRILVI